MTPLEQALREAVEARKRYDRVFAESLGQEGANSARTLVLAQEHAQELALKLVYDHADELLSLVGGWVPVSERLPSKTDMYWVAFSNGGTWLAMFRAGDALWIVDGDNGLTITHWQPLPAPPQEDDDA